MKVKALITGVENVKGENGKSGDSEKKWDFWKVNFIDTEDPTGPLHGMALPKDDASLVPLIQRFEKLKMQIIDLEVYVSGKYINFGQILAEPK